MSKLYSQNCTPANITLSTQNDVNQFTTNYGPCTVVAGDLTINGLGITDLSPLSGLLEIQGILLINDCDDLPDLNGLQNIRKVGVLEVTANNLFEDLGELENLEEIDGGLRICCMGNFRNFRGLENVKSIGGTLDICCMGGVQSFEGLHHIIKVGNLDICCMGGVLSLYGLRGLKKVEGFVDIGALGDLMNLDGLHNLHTVTGDVDISGLGSLSECCAIFPLLEGGGIGGTITMENNAEMGNCNNDGADIMEFCPYFVPTLSQWGLILLTLILLIFGLVTVRSRSLSRRAA